jgi:hypothetical protein
MTTRTDRGLDEPIEVTASDSTPIPTKPDQVAADIASSHTVHLLSSILMQLKIMNIHLAILTDNEIQEKEIE